MNINLTRDATKMAKASTNIGLTEEIGLLKELL